MRYCLATILLACCSVASALEDVVERGPVTVTASVTPDEVLIGDPVELEITVVAEKDVEILMPEFGESLDHLQIIEFVPQRRVDDQRRTVASQRYRLLPTVSGEQIVPPILVEFVDRRDGQEPAPEGFDAYEILTNRLVFDVESVVPASASEALQPPLGALDIRLRGAARQSWLAVVGAALALLVVAWVWSLLRRRSAVPKSAYQIAIERLEPLLGRPAPSGEDVEAFFVELSAIVREYLENRFRLRAPELTTEEFLEVASRARDLSRSHQQLLRDFLRQADLVKFAGLQPRAADIQESISAARRFLEETRDDIAAEGHRPRGSSYPPATKTSGNGQALVTR